MIVAANQPYFCPFPGFFFKAHQANVLVILDDVQFPQGTTWITRNRFKNDQGTLWMTIPVKKKGLGRQKIRDVRICHDGSWNRKHLESLKQAYAKGPFFNEHQGFFEDVFSGRFEQVVALDVAIITYVMAFLQIHTELVLLSALDVQAKGNQLLVDICTKLGATQFIAQKGAEKHLDDKAFQRAGIDLTVVRIPSPVYPQLWGDFIPNLSVFDLLFNCGPKARDILFR
jgi:hypothetical protein